MKVTTQHQGGERVISFFGDQCLRDAVVERVREHQRLDQIAQQIYWDGSKGCAIGCVLHGDQHLAFEQQLGLPVFLAYIDEHIFERLPLEEARAWPLRFIEAVPVGVDLELVFPRFMHWLLSDPNGMRQYANAETLPIIDSLVAMYARRIEGVPFDQCAAESAWSAATSAAESAAERAWSAARRTARSAAESARSAAWSAAECAASAAWSTAESAAASDVWSAMSAARSATESAAASAAWSTESAIWSAAEIRRQADYLIALLQSYESHPLTGLPPCTERLQALHFGE